MCEYGYLLGGSEESEVHADMASKREYYGNVRAPDFPPGLEWLNTDRRLSLVDLRGKFVLLDFWTYGCINCMHIIPDLKRLEATYPNELVVIGVHSAKFANESNRDNVRQIVLRYSLEHPIVNDSDFVVWNSYVVRAWPTTILIDPRGYVLAAHSGEGVYQAWNEIIAEAVRTYEAQGLIDRTPLKLALEKDQAPDTTLSFPGKVLADEKGDRLFIADTGHDRIVVATLAGEVQGVIGSGLRGLVDGALDEARFAHPQGMALDGDKLYIADTENHALRLADLRHGTVQTVAGDGTLAYNFSRGPASVARLNSPWDLVLVESHLYIAMAGTHQLWDLDLMDMTIGPYAGSGREGLLDGPLDRAALAQPSGITSDGRLLYFVDSEASAVRVAEPGTSGRVRTLIGQGLFEFGDVDGDLLTARLQHPLGILWYRGVLYVADTYNHKIKIVDPDASQATTWVGTGARVGAMAMRLGSTSRVGWPRRRASCTWPIPTTMSCGSSIYTLTRSAPCAYMTPMDCLLGNNAGRYPPSCAYRNNMCGPEGEPSRSAWICPRDTRSSMMHPRC